MSTRIFKIALLEKVSTALFEAVDLAKVKPETLINNQEVMFNFDGKQFGMKVEPYTEDMKDYLPIPSNHTDLQGYFNFGFDLEGTTQRERKQSYKELAQPLAVIVKSFLTWIEREKPNYITIYPDGDTEEKEKKLSLYVALLHREERVLNGLGYTWDFANSKKLGNIIVIKKNKE